MSEHRKRSERGTEQYEGPSAGGRRKPEQLHANPADADYDKKTDGPNRPSV